MDQYMKMVASDFVKSALLETIRKIIDNNIRIEVRMVRGKQWFRTRS